MFIEINENLWIYTKNLSAVQLVEEDGKYIWLFFTKYEHPFKSKTFDTKEEAIIWFRNIKYDINLKEKYLTE
ncbi:hypothetical protein JCM14244_03070 [Venenivibrio stagnispumantis]|uniref:Uncharacterized protein n=1 Tax=Venenivibrio stagnispumantis TaxID=407998 RepID=A0AA45WM56_9AQUI|nr:hypothetical protein [Venenivibrio stagnispumantis]MCW4572845.1 hypothetical protein [Venenivibrio stagnispumantis]SMP13154.1 hypothetical protein SAMN06264868_11056 [Venenivibrio stagnispumantis]